MSRRNAFTLVQLVVVIGIIAILISLFLPALSRARGGAWNGTCPFNLRQIRTYVTIYAWDSHNALRPRGNTSPKHPEILDAIEVTARS